jgi:pimeloyl-ACP methyl ester carboxylesterase
MNLYLKEIGKKNSRTIVLLHDFNMAGWMWDQQVKALSDYHYLVPDLPEHGLSKNIGPFTIKMAAELIVDVIKNKAHNGRAHLVGVSLGAQVILQILNIAPEVVDHVLITGALVNTIEPNESFLKLIDYLIEIYIPVKNDKLSIGSYIRSYNLPKNLIKKFKESTCIISSNSAERIIRENILFLMPENLQNVKNPVLVMVGEKDYKIIKDSARNLIKVLPNSKAYLAPGVGHIWNLESPKLFNQVLSSWMNDKTLMDSLLELKTDSQ